ncbi:DDE-type integrase/transposase/recombinase [Amycolatopsis sp. cmx-4-68]|uniref:DDE-type integrase/transposase/recombinase n=1 Tax=Amycolatopsis sp. cmx-4-68 TaxID=2790938 RepID=UPI0039798B95
MTEEIVAIHDESNGTYGTPRLHAALRARGRRHSRKRVARLLRAAGRAGRAPKRWRTTTVPDPAASTPADLIKRDFSCSTSDINTRWCGDIIYIHTWEGWLYLATVIDLGSRRVVGWATADHLRTDLIAEALNNAVAQRRPESGVIFHSDRGCPSSTPPPSPVISPTTTASVCRWDARDSAGTTLSPSRFSRPSKQN